MKISLCVSQYQGVRDFGLKQKYLHFCEKMVGNFLRQCYLTAVLFSKGDNLQEDKAR